MPSGGGPRTYLVTRGQRQEPLLPDPLRSSLETTLGKAGEQPRPYWAGVGRSPPLERLVRLQQGISGSGMGLKRGHLGTTPQLYNHI